ncbi:zinc finger protein 148-like isoform X2 [Stegostoma tigrinum]|uniref:zinc finger protein 148-like isoform X2 n=1 Tax=Stegostoma tigrinum TaxID=3053191 RepID=UPI0028705789|nr:zinc finger protein 148-like isoform X2 [Stegostoma tigrinum]
MSRVDGISDLPSVPVEGQQPLLEYGRTPQQASLVDNAMLQDNTNEVGILQDSSVSHEMVGSHRLLQSGAISHQGMITGNDALTQTTLRNADGPDSHAAVTVTQSLPCATQVLGKSRVLEGVEQFDGKKQSEQEDLVKLRGNENLLKLGENEELLKFRQHEELMKKQKSKKIRTPSKILVVGEDGSFLVKSPKTHICEQCSAAFRTNYHLQRHILIHTGEKPFHCDECDMRFIQKYHMERHKRTHSGEKPYQCEYCLQYFSRTDRLLKHRRMCHENQGKAPGKNPAMKTEPIILAINAENSFLSPVKDIINPRKKVKTAEKSALATLDKEETGNPAEGKMDKGECVEYYTSNLKVKDEYKVEQCSLVVAHSSQNNDHLGEAYQNQMNLLPTKLILKKVSLKKNQKTTEELAQTLPVSGNFDATKVNKYTYAMVDNPDLLTMEGPGADQGQDASRKPGGNSNYDDAMQFVKKKRFLQGTSSTSREYALTVGQIPIQPAATQAANTPVGDTSGSAPMLVQPNNTDPKSSQDKSGIPDEVLQTLLDHYTNKANGQVAFSVDAQAASNITVSSTDITNVPPSERVNESSQPAVTDNCNMLHEYSKFLQQALERTCHNDSYSAEQGLAYETETHPLTGSLPVQPLFSTLERQVFATMVTQHGFRPEVGAPLRIPSQKAQYSLLTGESQHPFAFIPTVTSSNSISAPPDFIEQVNTQKKREEPPAHHNHQMDTFGQDSRFSAVGGEMTPSFSNSTGGQVNLRIRQGSSDFSEFSLVNVPEARDQMSASSDVTGGQAFR